MPGVVAGRTEGPAHRMRGDEEPGNRHRLQAEPERLHRHDHGGDPRLFQQPRDVSDRHVTDGSDRNQQRRVHVLLPENLDPRGPALGEKPGLGRGPHEGVRRVGEGSDRAVLL